MYTKVKNWINKTAIRIMTDKRGAVSVELVLIIVVLIALVAAFKSGISSTLDTILSKISNKAAAI